MWIFFYDTTETRQHSFLQCGLKTYIYIYALYFDFHWSVLHLDWMDLLPICNAVTPPLVIWKALVHWVLQTFWILAQFVLKYQKFVFINNITNLIRKVFKYWEAVKLMLKNPNFLLSSKYCQSSSLKCQAHLICFQGKVYRMSTNVWKTIVHLSAVVSIEHGVHEEQRIGLPSHSQKNFSSKRLLLCAAEMHDGTCHVLRSQGSQVH